MASKIAHPAMLPPLRGRDQRLSIGDGAVPEQSGAMGKHFACRGLHYQPVINWTAAGP